MIGSLREVMMLDRENARGEYPQWQEMAAAIDALDGDIDAFLAAWFTEAPDKASKSGFSVTSR
ncbi:MAG: hypothetical protein AABZ39_05100 [Spirochaetota bacterium]